MTIWTMNATHADGTSATVPDFDDGGDINTLYAHQIALSPLNTKAVPQTPVSDPNPRDGGG